MPKTGNSGTVAFATTSLVLAWTKIGEYQQTRGKLATDHLGTEGFRTYMADDHEEPGEIELEAYFDPTVDLADITDVAEEITITYPLEDPDDEVAATLIGTGFLIAVGLPELVNGTVSKQKVKIAFDGQGDGAPSFSPELEEAPD
jgi:hypothetical protein